MTKAELTDYVAKESGMTKAAAEKAVEAVLAGITQSLKKGEGLTVVGFGSFSVVERKAREGRNPQTGAAIKIPAKKVVTFKPGKNLKEL
ncbi:MAG TPA: HU family DNA-binding protein [Syntrophales bacterium]|nr:HU family DNA-binding protein [Syntrophales bacterium]